VDDLYGVVHRVAVPRLVLGLESVREFVEVRDAVGVHLDGVLLPEVAHLDGAFEALAALADTLLTERLATLCLQVVERRFEGVEVDVVEDRDLRLGEVVDDVRHQHPHAENTEGACGTTTSLTPSSRATSGTNIGPAPP